MTNDQFFLTEQEYNNFKAIEQMYLKEVNKHLNQNNKNKKEYENNIMKLGSQSQTGDFININKFRQNNTLEELNNTLKTYNRRIINDYIIILKMFKEDIEKHIHTFIHCNRFKNQNLIYFDESPALYVGSKLESANFLDHYFILLENNQYYLIKILTLIDTIILDLNTVEKRLIICKQNTIIIDYPEFTLLSNKLNHD